MVGEGIWPNVSWLSVIWRSVIWLDVVWLNKAKLAGCECQWPHKGSRVSYLINMGFLPLVL